MSGERPVIPVGVGGSAAVDDTVFTRASPQLALLPRDPIILRPPMTLYAYLYVR